jgi:hypothetical protein
LSIGNHKLKFRFVDSIGATKVLEYEIIIIPRPPILKAPKFEGNSLILSGTGLSNSEVLLTVSVGASNYTQIANTSSEGTWDTSITFDTVASGIYTVFGYTRKAGYASNPSESVVMEYGNSGIIDSPSQNSNISFAFNQFSLKDLPTIISLNPDLLITVISAILFGALITSLFFIIFKTEKRKKDEHDISEKINGKPNQEKTLMELFSQDQENKEVKTQKEKKKEKKKTKKEEKETTFTKKDFLKDFKKFDPDKDSGKENRQPIEKDKKDVLVTLTSKVEE